MPIPLPRRSLHAALLISSALTAFTQENDVIELNQIVVSISGREQSLADVQASVQMIDAQTITERGAAPSAQALKQAVGVSASSSGVATWVRMRGQEQTGTLLLTDGMPRSSNYGQANCNGIDVNDIERIEVVRGPMSALYGSDALGGVVNVITKRSGQNPGSVLTTRFGLRPDEDERGAAAVHFAHEFGDQRLGHRIALGVNTANG